MFRRQGRRAHVRGAASRRQHEQEKKRDSEPGSRDTRRHTRRGMTCGCCGCGVVYMCVVFVHWVVVVVCVCCVLCDACCAPMRMCVACTIRLSTWILWVWGALAALLSDHCHGVTATSLWTLALALAPSARASAWQPQLAIAITVAVAVVLGADNDNTRARHWDWGRGRGRGGPGRGRQHPLPLATGSTASTQDTGQWCTSEPLACERASNWQLAASSEQRATGTGSTDTLTLAPGYCGLWTG